MTSFRPLLSTFLAPVLAPILVYGVLGPTTVQAPAPPAPGAPEGLAAELDARAAAMEGYDPAELWNRALALRALAGPVEAAEGGVQRERAAALDRLLEARLLAGGESSETHVLLLAAARLAGADADGATIRAALEPLLGSEREEIVRFAAELLTDESVAALGEDPRWDLVEVLLEQGQSTHRTARTRIACARTAYELGQGGQRRSARAQILAFRRDADPSVEAEAVLALAALGEPIAGTLAEDLERLAQLPAPVGPLAGSYLERADARELADERYRKLQRLYDERALPEELSEVDAVMAMVQQLHLDGDKVSRKELVDAALDGMLRALDPHSSFMPSEVFTSFYWDTFDPQYGGIGAYIDVDRDDGVPTVARPIYSGPAYRAGLLSDDKIVRIGDWPTLGEPLDAVTDRLKGKPGTPVRVYVWRRGMNPELIDRPSEDMAVEIVRERIALPTVAWQMLPGKVGLVELKDFNGVASRELARAITSLRVDGLEALVLDLRFNGGGVLNEARRVADLFLPPDKLVVTTEYRVDEPERLYTRAPAVVPAEIPVVVLVNRFSASAAEIVAGALADHGRAVVIGERTYGKGAIQNLIPVLGTTDDSFLDENGNGQFDAWEELVVDQNENGEYDFGPRVRMTVGRYLLPSGRSIHRELDADRNVVWEGGIDPDQTVEMPRVEGWRWEERLRLNAEGLPRRYVDERWEEHHALFRELAECDRRDPGRYPDFDAFWTEVDTPLGADDLRALLRSELRRRIQDERGGEYPFGDYQEDPQLQAGVVRLLGDLGRSPWDFPDYGATFEALEAGGVDALLASRGPDPEELDRRRRELRSALSGDGHLDREAIEGLLDLLSSLED